MMKARALAQEASSWYLSNLDPYSSHGENVKMYLRGPVLALTLKILQPPAELPVGLELEIEALPAREEEKKSSGDLTGGHWKNYLHRTVSEDGGDVWMWNERDQAVYDTLERRTKARMEAFLAGCVLAVADDVSSRRNAEENKIKLSKSPPMDPKVPVMVKAKDITLAEGLAGFNVSKSGSATSSPSLRSMQASSALLRTISTSSNSSAKRLRQFRCTDLATRLELYIRNLNRVRALGRECVVTAEPPRAIRARANAVVTTFVATVGCVRSMGPSLTRLLQCLTRELLAVECLGGEVCNVIRRLVLEYEHQISFASLAFLSSPEASADTLLTPMIISYLEYLQSNWESLVAECELERMLSTILDAEMRTVFKTIEFHSIGHLLEVCQAFRNQLHNIELPPCLGGICSEDTMSMCSNTKALQQAIRDIQRETLTVNGRVLPPVKNRKELLQVLSQTLNSRNLTSLHGKRRSKQKISRKHRTASCPSFISVSSESLDPENDGLDPDGFLSSGNEGDTDGSVNKESDHSDESTGKSSIRRNRRRNFHLSTVDMMTRRLLIASSRTGMGGDAYFVVKDLFGGEDVEVVPSSTVPTYGRMTRTGTIEIVVRLASVTIKCHASFDVFPKSLVGECEPLIQLHTSTTETISLREVRASDGSEDDLGNVQSDDSDCDNKGSKLVLQEKRTEKTGWRTLAIRPALYEKVEVWNTPS